MAIDKNTLVMLHMDGTATDECGHKFEATDVAYAHAKANHGAMTKGHKSIIVCKKPGFKLGGADFTIDFWVQTTGSTKCGNLYSISYGPETSQDCNNCISDIMQINASHGNYEVRTNWQSTSYGPTFSISENAFHHVAVVYQHSSALTTVYVDGTKVQTLKRNCPVHDVTSISLFRALGRKENENFMEHGTVIDEFRISSCARWTGNFDPYPEIEKTKPKAPDVMPRKAVHEKIGKEEWNTLMWAVTDLAEEKGIELHYTVPSVVNCIKDGRKWVQSKETAKSSQVKNILGAINQLEGAFNNNCCQANCCQSKKCQSCESQCSNCTQCRNCDNSCGHHANCNCRHPVNNNCDCNCIRSTPRRDGIYCQKAPGFDCNCVSQRFRPGTNCNCTQIRPGVNCR